MKKINIRDANQRFSQLVREVQETGEPVQIFRHGELAAELHPPPADRAIRKLTAAQDAALDAMLETAQRIRGKSDGRKLTRDEMHER